MFRDGQRIRIWGIEGIASQVSFEIGALGPRADIKLVLMNENGEWPKHEYREVSMEDVDVREIKFLQEEQEMSNIKVTEKRINHLMKTAEYDIKTVFGKCTIVAAKLENGFIITESSACVDPANYDKAMGERICKEKIRDRLWELEGYALQKGLHKLVQED